MKYTIKEHPIILMIPFALILVGISVWLYFYTGSYYAIGGIVLACIASIYLIAATIADYVKFKKKIKENQKGENNSNGQGNNQK